MQGPRLYRFFNYESMAVIPAPTAGWNPDANPWELADTQAPVLDNALIRPGRVVPRGALNNWADLSSVSSPGPPLNVCGVQPVPGTSKLAVGRKLPDATGFVDPWFAPIVRPTATGALALPTADLVVSSGSTALTNTATAANLIPGPRGITFEGQRYFIGYGTATSPVHDSASLYFAQSTNLCTLSSAGAPSALANAPRGFIDIKGYQSRIWGLGGIDDPGSGTTFNPLTLFFTNPIGPGGGNAASYADWKDPVGGITNKIVMDGDTTDPGVGLALVRNGLLIFRYASVWLLKGSTTANYTLVPVSQDTGCVDPRSIVETDEGVYYMSRQGLMLTNGVTVKNVSGPVTHTLQTAVGLFTAAVKSSFGGWCSCALASGGQIVVSVGVPSVTSNQPDGHIQPIWCAMYDPSANAWTRITSALFATDGTIVQSGNNYPGYVFNTPDRRLLSIGDKYITQWEAESASSTTTPLTATDFPNTATNDAAVGVTPWTNPTNIELSGGSFATVTDGVTATSTTPSLATTSGSGLAWSNLSGPSSVLGTGTASTGFASGVQNSQVLGISQYGFSIPAGATITGVEVMVNKTNGGISSTVVDLAIQLLKAGTAVGSNRAVGGAWGGVQTYGGVNDLWGTTLTPADVNNSGFGFAISGTMQGSNAAAAVNGPPEIIVFYTLGGSELLKATSYGFAIPTTATINGIQVTVLRKSGSGVITDTNIQLYKAGTLQATNRSAGALWGTSLASANFGGASDLWGGTWTPADINNSGFGVGVAAHSVGGADTASVDSITITVYYTITSVVQQLSFIKQPGLYDTDPAGLFQPIPFLWRTKLLPIVGVTSATRKKAQLKRWVADYVFQGSALPSTKGFTVSLKDSTGALIADSNAQVVLPITNNSTVASSISGGPPNASTSIQRISRDAWAEVIDVCLEIAWLDVQQSVAPSASIAEIYTAGIEFQHTSELR